MTYSQIYLEAGIRRDIFQQRSSTKIVQNKAQGLLLCDQTHRIQKCDIGLRHKITSNASRCLLLIFLQFPANQTQSSYTGKGDSSRAIESPVSRANNKTATHRFLSLRQASSQRMSFQFFLIPWIESRLF